MKKVIAIVSLLLYRCLHLFLSWKLVIRYGGIIIFPVLKVDSSNIIILNHFSRLIRGRLKMTGQNNRIDVNGTIYKSNIIVEGNDNLIQIGEKAGLKRSDVVIRGTGNKLFIDDLTTIGQGCWLIIMGENKTLSIGKDCMIADQVDLWASDSHPIYDDSEKSNNFRMVTNPSGNIIIKDHVWLGKRSSVLKNVTIGENSVVGINSVVTKDVPEGSVVVGNPAKIVRNHVNWSRQHITV